MIDPALHLVLLAALTVGVGTVMVGLGMGGGLLQSRTCERRCPHERPADPKARLPEAETTLVERPVLDL